MPNEQELHQRVRSRVADLTKAVADADFWHDHWLEQANDQRQQAIAGLEAAHQRTLATARRHVK
jgi:hypothetical protein